MGLAIDPFEFILFAVGLSFLNVEINGFQQIWGVWVIISLSSLSAPLPLCLPFRTLLYIYWHA